MTLASFFGVMPMLLGSRIVDSAEEMMRVYNRRLYGLGHSENDGIYIEEYRQQVLQNQMI